MKILQLLLNNFKNIVISFAVILVIIFAYKWYHASTNNEQLHNELIGQQTQYQQLTKYVAQLETKYASQKELYDNAVKDFNEVKKNKDEKIKSLSNTVYTLQQQIEQQTITTDTIYAELRIQGKDSPPIGYVILYPNKTVKKGNYKFDVEVQEMQVVDENTGKYKVYSKAYYVVKENGLADTDDTLKKWKDEKYPLAISQGIVIVDPTEDNNLLKERFFLWAPHYALGFNIGVQTGTGTQFVWQPELRWSLMGYGLTKNDLRFKFLGYGVGFGSHLNEFSINFHPIDWRPLDMLPNTFIGPMVGWSWTWNNIFYALSISVNF